MKKSFLFISCEEAHHICDKSQYGEATFWERVKLSIRLSWCQVTRAYTKRNRKLTKTMNGANIDCLEGSKKEELKSMFQKELSKNN